MIIQVSVRFIVLLVMWTAMSAYVHAENNIALLDRKVATQKKITKEGNGSEVTLYIFKDHLKNVIAEVVRRDNVSLKVEENVKGVVEGKKLTGTRHDVLKKLSREFDFDWFEYNNTLYVSNKYERSTKFFTVNAANLRRYLLKLDEAGANMGAFQTQYIDQKTTSVSGPPGYIAIVSTIIDAHNSRKKKLAPTDYNVDLYKGVKLHKIELEKTDND